MLSAAPSRAPRAYRHDALLYDGPDDFHTSVSAFVDAAVTSGAPVLVVASAEKIDRLRQGTDSDLVQLADMQEVGRNPARIIPAWRAFVDAHPATTVFGVGEPVPPGRRASEVSDYQQVESLLNVAFDAADDFWLRCPYDVSALAPGIVAEARRSHPTVVEGGVAVVSDDYRGAEASAAVLDAPLPEPASEPAAFTLRPGQLHRLRRFVADLARGADLPSHRVEDLVLAVNEVASNSLLYAGGGADVRVWREDALVIEVRDTGVMTDALAGRVLPGVEEHDARGLWIANHLCDFVQVRSSAQGSVVRLHVRLTPAVTRR